MGILVIVLIMNESSCVPIKSVQSSTKGSEPQVPCSIFINCGDIIRSYTVRGIRIMLVMDKLFCCSIKFVESALFGSDPQILLMIFID